MGVGTIRDDPPRSLVWPPGPKLADADLVEQREQFGVIAGLAGCDADRHRPPPAIDGEVDLAGQSAPGPAEPFAVDREVFDPGAPGPPLFRAIFAKAEVSSRGELGA